MEEVPMKLVITKDYEEMSQVAVEYLLGEMNQNRKINLCITAGKTPERIYEILAEKVQGRDFSNVHYYNFDESYPMDDNEYGVTMTELKKLYFDKASVNPENIHPLTMENYQTWDDYVDSIGRFDIIMMGLGSDGHFCANLPGTNCLHDLKTRLLSFDIPDNGTMHFASMGTQSVMASKHLLFIVNGEHKAEILKQVLVGPIDEECPSSVLKLHPNFTVIADEAAAKYLTK